MFDWRPDPVSVVLGIVLALVVLYGIYTLDRRAVRVNASGLVRGAEDGLVRDFHALSAEAETELRRLL